MAHDNKMWIDALLEKTACVLLADFLSRGHLLHFLL